MQQRIVLDTLGKLHAYGYRLFGWCEACAALYRPDARQNPPASFDIDLAALIAERGADQKEVRTKRNPDRSARGGPLGLYRRISILALAVCAEQR